MIQLGVVIGIKNSQFLKDFGSNLRKIRLDKNLSQAFLADLAGIERSQILRIEAGKINTTISTVKILADALQIPPEELLRF